MSLINNEQKMLDIVFANRNKSYGAYAIRSAYGNTLFKSLFIVFFTVISSLGLAMWLKDKQADVQAGLILENDSILVIPFKLPEEPMVPKTDPAPKSSGGSVASSATSTLINEHTTDSVKQTVNTDITPVNTNTSTASTGSGTSTSSLTGTGTNTKTTGGGDPLEGFGVDENPEFEGGHNALLAFVKKNLVYPAPAVESGKQGTLYIKFVVDESGKVSNIFLQNNLGYGLDDEALRVVRLIPKFKSPGKVKGQPVKTYYQIPIKFKLG